MRPTEIDAVANAVVGSLSGAGAGLLGCGSLSSPIAFDVDYLACGHFECGGAARFDCQSGFGCGGRNEVGPAFLCDDSFDCSEQYLLSPDPG